jgi:hypothetical protein
MGTARVITDREVIPHRAACYRLEDGVMCLQEFFSPTLNRTADGSLLLTALDLAKWDRAAYRGALALVSVSGSNLADVPVSELAKSISVEAG